jgi:hypothetical protein
MSFIEITVRDGRIGREGGKAGESQGHRSFRQADPSGQGAVLKAFMSNRFYEIDDKLTLDDGTEVVVIGTRKEVGATWKETVHIGDIWPISAGQDGTPGRAR